MDTNTPPAAVPQQPKLNGQPVTQEQLEETRKNLPGNQKLFEVAPGENKVLTRIRG